MKLRQSVSLPMFYPAFPNRETLIAQIAEIGFQGVEIWGRDDQFEETLALAAKYHLKLICMLGHKPSSQLNRYECHEDFEKQMCESIDLASAHGIPSIICFSGNRQENQSDEVAIHIIAEGMGRIIPYAEKKGITLLLELLNSKIDHPKYLADHTKLGVAICKRVNSFHLRLLYDVYHMQIMEGDLIRTIQDHLPWIGHFHTAGNPGRHAIDESQEINYSAVASAIRKAGFPGFIGHEFSPLNNPTHALQRAFEIIEPKV